MTSSRASHDRDIDLNYPPPEEAPLMIPSFVRDLQQQPQQFIMSNSQIMQNFIGQQQQIFMCDSQRLRGCIRHQAMMQGFLLRNCQRQRLQQQQQQQQITIPPSQNNQVEQVLIDSDINIISPASFAEEVRARRNQGAVNQATVAASQVGVGEAAAASKKRRACRVEEEERGGAVFECPICQDKIKEETTTRCGHIFCKECIETALAYEKKCPTCRTKLNRGKPLQRIYLPAITSS